MHMRVHTFKHQYQYRYTNTEGYDYASIMRGGLYALTIITYATIIQDITQVLHDAYWEGVEVAKEGQQDPDHDDEMDPGHASDGDFLPGEILLKTIDFERPGGREWLPSGTPFQLFFHFFWKRFRTRACTDIQCTFAQKCFFCSVKKVCSKAPIGYVAWGLLKDPLLHVLLPQLTKQKSKN